MKTRHLLASAAIFAAAFTSPATGFAEDYNVTIAAGHPPVFRWVRMFPEAFIPTVQAELEGTGNTMTFSEQYGGAIAGVGEELEAAEAGLAELGTCSSLFDQAKLALQNVTYYTPFVSDDAGQVSEFMTELHRTNEALQQSFLDNGTVYLGGNIAIDDYLLMTNFPVNSLDDLKGRKIAAPGSAGNWLSGTGAVGVSGNLTTYYNELKAGVYDGVIVFASAALPGKLYEVAPYVLRAGLGAQFSGAICANQDWWEGLPEDVQNAVTAGADAAQEWYINDLEKFVEVSFKGMAENGATITEASPEMREAWANGMDNAAKKWAEDLDGKGKPGTEILKIYMEGMRAAGATPVRNWDQE